MIITRKIEIYVNESDKDKKAEYYDRLFKILYTVHRFANLCASHLYFADNIADFVYLTTDARDKVKFSENLLTDSKKKDEGILISSYDNLVYELSKTFPEEERKGITKILADTGNRIIKAYKKKTDGESERLMIKRGKRSVKNYKLNIPIPFSKQSFKIEKSGNDYIFDFYHIPFKTKCGKDKSGNRIIINRLLAGEYDLSDSSIQYAKKYDRETGKAVSKWMLQLCVNIPETRLQAKKGVKVKADLNLVVPIIATCGKITREFGTKEEFLYQRIQIQSKLKNLQKSLRWANGGNGRKAKLQAIERFKLKEKNYIKTKLHAYSRALVNFAIKERAEKIELVNQKLKEEMAKDLEPVLRNWSYYGLKQMIEYKAMRVGISVELN
jgi:IS605 OrfB family transposase